MRLSNRLLSNAATTYLRLGTTFLLGLFSTWYILGAVGVVGFGLIALASSSTSPSRSVELALRSGLVRELATAIASADPQRVQRSVTAAFRLCSRATILLLGICGLIASLAYVGVFNLPADQPELRIALTVLVLGEGIHAAARLLGAPYLQSLFAAQKIGLDNLLIVIARFTYVLSAVVLFGWLFRDASVATQLLAFAASRITVQLSDVALGIWLAKRQIAGVEVASAVDEAEYAAIRKTVWHSSQVDMLLNLNPQFLAILINLFFGLAYNSLWQIVVQFSGFARDRVDQCPPRNARTPSDLDGPGD